MRNDSIKTGQDINVSELMKVLEYTHGIGINFHIYKRKRLPSCIEIGSVTDAGWLEFKQALKSDYLWNKDDELSFSEKHGNSTAKTSNYIYLKEGSTIFRNSQGWVTLAYDHDCETEFLDELKIRIKKVCEKSSINEIGFLQMSGPSLYVKYCKYKPYKKDLIPYMGEDINRFKDQVLNHLNEENGNGLYLLYGQTGNPCSVM